MKLVVKNRIYAGVCLFVAIIGMGPELRNNRQKPSKAARQTQVASNSQRENHPKHGHTTAQPSRMRVPIDWHKSSETVPYPDLATTKDFWVKVSLKKNRTYLYDGKKLLYTMYSTGGMHKRNPQTGKMESMTPTGTYYAQAERGDSFFNSSLNEGANYYVSWLDHGTYLFHSVPTVAGGAYNVKEADKLGKSTGSHGCIRLSIPDAQWMSTHLPVGTKIVIVN